MPFVKPMTTGRGMYLTAVPRPVSPIAASATGYDLGAARYNRTGESPNNDFLRYEVAPGHWVGELAAGQRFLRWRLHHDSPKETRALLGELEPLRDDGFAAREGPCREAGDGAAVDFVGTVDEKSCRYFRCVSAR